MPIRRYKPEQIVTLLRQVEVGIANGKITPVLRQNVIRAENAASPRCKRLNNSQELTQGALRRSQDFLWQHAEAVADTYI
jgi:hypothetical protein